MITVLPTANDYQQALQNPQVYLSDLRLKACRTEVDPFGMPRPRCGGFAITYRLENNGRRWAVRCFSRSSPDRESRYKEICKYISSHSSDILIGVEYLPKGILVKGSWYPITLMDWVEGDTLGNYIYQNIKQPKRIAALPDEFLQLVAELERLGIAHGDLSHQNILIRNGQMVLIDYDGMYVPQFKGYKSSELGNPYFQHPRRSEKDFGPHLDRFSQIVLYMTLCALATSPRLYNEYGKGGEGLLFRRDDFIRPQESRLLRAIEQISDLEPLVLQFQQVCQTDLDNIPRLDDFIQHQPIVIPAGIEPPAPVYISLYPIFNAVDRNILLEHQGEYVTVIGKIEDSKEDLTRHGAPYAFLNFGNWRDNCFTVVFWSDALQLLKSTGKTPREYRGKWASVTGLLSSYDGGWGIRPQIILDSPTEIEILSKEDAEDRLNGMILQPKPFKNVPKKLDNVNPVSVDLPVKAIASKVQSIENIPPKAAPVSVSSLPPKVDVRNKIDQLYGNKPSATTSSIQSKPASVAATPSAKPKPLTSPPPSSSPSAATSGQTAISQPFNAPVSQNQKDSAQTEKQKELRQKKIRTALFLIILFELFAIFLALVGVLLFWAWQAGIIP